MDESRRALPTGMVKLGGEGIVVSGWGSWFGLGQLGEEAFPDPAGPCVGPHAQRQLHKDMR